MPHRGSSAEYRINFPEKHRHVETGEPPSGALGMNGSKGLLHFGQPIGFRVKGVGGKTVTTYVDSPRVYNK